MPILKMFRRELYSQARGRGAPRTDAYIEAGYSPHSDQTRQQLVDGANHIEGAPGVRERIAEIIVENAESREIAEERRRDAAAFDDAMGKVEILRGLREVFTLAIAPSLKVRGTDEETGEPVVIEGNPNNLGAANRALELMGKEEGMFVDVKHIKTDNTSTMNRTQLEQAIAAIDEKLAASDKAKLIEVTVID